MLMRAGNGTLYRCFLPPLEGPGSEDVGSGGSGGSVATVGCLCLLPSLPALLPGCASCCSQSSVVL